MRYYYSYEEFREDLKTLCEMIEREWEFDAILAIARGGMTMGHMMGEYFNTRYVFTINAISYENDRKLNEVKIFNIPDLKDFKRVLVVDDIVDSGDSMRDVLNLLKNRFSLEFKTAVIFHKEKSSFYADFWVKRPKGWVDFFWSVDLR